MKALCAEGKISDESRVVFIDDGSRDNTWGVIEALSGQDPLFAGIALSRNRGHQYALLAGLMAVRDEVDMVISIDADLQDDIDAIDKMVDKYLEGFDIVLGVRRSREKDGVFKRITAECYYKLLGAFSRDVVFNHADFRLMSSRTLAALSEYGEHGLYLRGLIPMLGYKTAIVEYERGVRLAGESKYPLKRMLALALDGVMSLSLQPLRIVTWMGVLSVFLAAVLFIYSIVMLAAGYSMLNWKIITVSIWFVGGLILLALGIVGEYVGRTYMETKRRPRYHIDRTTENFAGRAGEDQGV